MKLNRLLPALILECLWIAPVLAHSPSTTFPKIPRGQAVVLRGVVLDMRTLTADYSDATCAGTGVLLRTVSARNGEPADSVELGIGNEILADSGGRYRGCREAPISFWFQAGDEVIIAGRKRRACNKNLVEPLFCQVRCLWKNGTQADFLGYGSLDGRQGG
jgi:hypothetical protein